MTKVVLNCKFEKPESCDVCPFCDDVPEMDYGECVGYSSLYCGLMASMPDSSFGLGITNNFVGYSYEEIGILENCPIVCVEEES